MAGVKNSSYIEISKSAIKNNLKFIRNYVNKDVRISSVVKANAYGHSIEEFVPLAEKLGIRHFSVFSAKEAQRVHNVIKKDTTILIMGYLDNADLEWIIKNRIEFFVFDMDRLKAAAETAKRIGEKAIIHLEVETGLNRTGFNREDLTKVIKIIRKGEFIFRGLCTHLAGAESVANYFRIKNQVKKFKIIKRWFKRRKLEPELCHMACSAAMINYPETQMDMVRVGFLQYGSWPSAETFHFYNTLFNIGVDTKPKNPIRRVLTWKSVVMSTKRIEKGSFIGYGTTCFANENMRIALVPVGYAQSYNRNIKNQGRVIIRRNIHNIIGFLNMNLMIVDVTSHPEIRKGDHVVLIGKQGRNEISIVSFSEMSNLINYGLLSRLPGDIPRFVVK